MTEMPDFIYKSICRVCLGIIKSDNMVTLLDNSNDDGLSLYGRYIKMLTKFSLKSDDLLPSNMCSKCLEMLKQTINLKFTCDTTEKVINNLKEIDTESSTSVSGFKEKLMEYSLYRHYFKEDNDITESSDMNPDIVSYEKITDSQSDSESIDQEYDLNEENLHTEMPSLKDDISDVDEPNLILDMMEQSLRNYLSSCKNNKQREKYFKTSISQSERNESFNMKQSLKKKRSYKSIKHTKDGLTCEYCNKVLKTVVTYKKHIQIHTKEYRFTCDICGKGYVTKHVMRDHMLKKHDVGPHTKCKLCDFKTIRPAELKEHIRFHTGERPWACEICGMTFRRRYIWRKHKIRHAEKTVACPHCSKLFYMKNELSKHINKVHK